MKPSSPAKTAQPAVPLEETVGTAEQSMVETEEYAFLKSKDNPAEFQSLGGYRILKVLGKGGMGLVLQAEDEKLKRKVAMKVMLPKLAANETHKQRFLREAQAAAAIEHDHIIPIYRVDEDRGVPFLVMKMLKGEPLDEFMKRTPKLPPELVQLWSRQIALGLAAAHERGLVHRDIKPANIFLETSEGEDEQSRVRILDFGLARPMEEDLHLTGTGQVVGTPAYMSPEQARGKQIGASSDLFSLGVMMYQMATGTRPFTGDTVMALMSSLALDTPAAPNVLNPKIPANLSDLIMQLLEKDPAKRPASARAVAKSLTGPSITTIIKVEPLESDINQAFVFDDAPAAPKVQKTTAPAESQQTRVKTAPASPPVPTLKKRSPAIWIAAGLLFLALCAFATFEFVLKTPNGNLVVEVNDAETEAKIKNGEIHILDKEGKVRYTLKPSELNKKLPVGDYQIDVTGADGVKFNTKEFKIEKGKEATVRAFFEKSAAAAVAKVETDAGKTEKVIAIPSASKTALDFNVDLKPGHARVEIPAFLEQNKPFTAEMFVTARKREGTNRMLFAAQWTMLLKVKYDNVLDWHGPQTATQADTGVVAANALPIGRRSHLAAVCTGDELRLYVDGKLLGRKAVVPAVGIAAISLGGLAAPESTWQPFDGLIDDFRLSTSARYDKDFAPPTALTADKDTFIRYDFNEGEGDVLKDSSGNNHHGKIVGAKWVKGEAVPAPATSAGLKFNGADDHVVLGGDWNSLGTDWTWETWVTPTRFDLCPTHSQYLFSYVNTATDPYISYRLSRSIFRDPMNPEAIRELFHAATPPIGPIRAFPALPETAAPVHLQFQFSKGSWQMYVNGRSAGPGTRYDFAFKKIEKPSTHALLGGHYSDDARTKVHGAWNGTIHQVRISRKIRNGGDFEPEASFRADADTFALYKFDEGQGDVLKDSSGNNRHGKIVGAKWVKGESSAAAPTIPPPQTYTALKCTKTQHPTLPASLRIDETGDFTVECFVKLTGKPGRLIGNGTIDIQTHTGKWIFEVGSSGGGAAAYDETVVETHKRSIHLAGVRKGNEIRLFVDGEPMKPVRLTGNVTKKSDAFTFGGMEGEIHEVRFSKVARYNKNFKPEKRFAPDKDTLALYHCDEGGDVLKDSSGNNHHGKLGGATWVKGETVSPVEAERRAAEWVLAKGGKLTLHDGRIIENQAGLPEGELRVTSASLATRKLTGPETDLAPIRDLRYLTYLSITGANATAQGIASLETLPQLGRLSWEMVEIDDNAVAALTKLRNLRSLYIAGARIPPTQLESLVREMPKLTALNLEGSKDIDDASVPALSSLKRLTSLKLPKTKVTAAGVAELRKALPGCKIDWEAKK